MTKSVKESRPRRVLLIALVLVLPLIGRSIAVSGNGRADERIDHFACYPAEVAEGETGFGQGTVGVADQFQTRSADVGAPNLYCVAANKNGEGIIDPEARLLCHEFVGESAERLVETTNQFGRERLLGRAPRGLCMPATNDPGDGSQSSAAAIDPFQCYGLARPEEGPHFKPRRADVEDEFGPRRLKLHHEEQLCNPASVDGAALLDPEAHLECYRADRREGEPRFPGRTVTVSDRFGSGRLEISEAQSLLCVPSEKRELGTPTATPTGLVSPTPTATAATSTPTASQTPTATGTPTVAPTVTGTPTVTPTVTQSATVTPTATQSPTQTPTATQTPSVTPTATQNPTATPTTTQTPTQTPIATQNPTQTPIPPPSPTSTPTPTATLAAATPTAIATATEPPGGIPPDPATVAPPPEGGVATNVADSTEFLYTGPNPIQTGVAPGTIEERRAAVVRGKVLDRVGAALSGVEITILDHPELGQTLSRADGAFDMAVNGGGPLAINYRKSGFLPAQRQVNVPWQDFTVVPDVILIPKDQQVTTIDLDSSAAMQVAQGSPVADADGGRQATLFIPSGTQAELVMPDGTTQPTSTLNIRLTEYTVGPDGPKTMPGVLPPSSGYTYAVEIGADEAVAKKNGQDVLLSQPVFFYLENFLNFPVGMIVPMGFYDNDRAAWVPSLDGRVIEITGVTAGRADVDSVGSGSEPPLVLSGAELQQLATQYSVGQTLWRVPITHLSTWDGNWPFGPPPDATAPGVPEPTTDETEDQCVEELPVSSVIECQNQILGETLDVVGTPFTLDYRSNRVPGRAGVIDIQVSGASVPASLKRIDLSLGLAGRSFSQSFAAAPNQRTSFVWDGKDAYGRAVQGTQPLTGTIGFVYDGFYRQPGSSGPAFGQPGGVITGNRARQEITISQSFAKSIGAIDARGHGLGGWTLSPHHAYDPIGLIVHRGNGRRQSAAVVGRVIDTFAGGVFGVPNQGDGGPATQAQLGRPSGVAVAPDGSVFIADTFGFRIRRVAPDGIISTVAGNGSQGFSGDGGPATQATLSEPRAVAIGADGSLFIADTDNNRIRRVAPDGIISTVAGNGTLGFGGDGGPATLAQLRAPFGVAIGPDGSLFIADSSNHLIRRVATDGIITTVAGTKNAAGFGGDGGPATQARLASPISVAFGPDGSLFIADTGNRRIRRVAPDGIITTVAGNGTQGFSGDGGPATEAAMNTPFGVATTPDGSFYFSDGGTPRVRLVTPDGIITTVAGNGVPGDVAGDGGPATQAVMQPFGVAVGPDGSLFIAEPTNDRIRRVASPMPGFAAGDSAVASEDGGSLYQFNAAGRHLRTLDTLTAATLYAFTYDAAGRLTEIRDGDGNVTTIQHDSSGNPTAIIGPFGQQTTLGVDANGFLDRVTNPAGETFAMTYTPEGLLTSVTDPRSNTSSYQYDTLGRLSRTDDAAGGSHTLTRTELANGHEISKTTALGRTSTYRVEDLSTGDRRLTNTAADGTVLQIDLGQDGTQTVSTPDGSVSTAILGPDPRFGMQAPLVSSQTLTAPGAPVFSRSYTETATLGDPNNPLSLQGTTSTSTLTGETFARSYDAQTRTVTYTTPAGRTLTGDLDALGRAAKSRVPGLGAVTASRDSRGRLSSVTIDGGNDGTRTFTYSYDSAGFLDSIVDPIGRLTGLDYDPADRLTSKTRPDGQVVAFSYDLAGNLASVTPPGRPAHGLAYSPRNELTLVTPPVVPGTGPTAFVYDADRRLTTVSRPDGRSIELGYDSAGRVASRTFLTAGAVTDVETFAYDSAGRLATATAGGITTTYSYDGAVLSGLSWVGAVAGSVTRTYDASGQTASESVNGGNAISFARDGDGLLTAAGSLSLGRDPQSGLETSSTLGALSDSNSSNGFGEIASYSFLAGGTPLYGFDLTRDGIGRVARAVETVNGITDVYDYGYDVLGQLVSVDRNAARIETYAYDANGNRTSATVGGVGFAASYDAQDRLLQYGGSAFAYNGSGQLESRTVSGQTTGYRYDALGNLRGVTLPGGTTIDYVVDAGGRRIGKRVNGAPTQGFLYDSKRRVVAELDGNGALANRFVYTTGATPAYLIRGGVPFDLVTDAVGSVRLVVDSGSGAIVQRLDYDSFGGVLLDTNPGFQPFGFAGGLYDPDTGLVRFGARDYDPATGRWTTKDPIGFSGGDANLYRYVSNDPVNLADPLGLTKVDDELAQLSAWLDESTDVDIPVGGAANLSPEDLRKLERQEKVLGRIEKLLRIKDAAKNAAEKYGTRKGKAILGVCLLAAGLGAQEASASGDERSTWEQVGEEAGKAYLPVEKETIEEGVRGYVDSVVDFVKEAFENIRPESNRY